MTSRSATEFMPFSDRYLPYYNMIFFTKFHIMWECSFWSCVRVHRIFNFRLDLLKIVSVVFYFHFLYFDLHDTYLSRISDRIYYTGTSKNRVIDSISVIIFTPSKPYNNISFKSINVIRYTISREITEPFFNLKLGYLMDRNSPTIKYKYDLYLISISSTTRLFTKDY